MKDQITALLADLRQQTITFTDVLAFIEAHYKHTPTAFRNGDVYNEASQNQGSAKVFAFAQLNNMSIADTLSLFAEHHRSVLDHPDAADHQNIRQFMTHGFSGIEFEGTALSEIR